MPPKFIAHNIRLDDGTRTMPDQPYLLEDISIVPATRRLLELALGGDLRGRSIVDVGCLEGGHTVEFARAGMVATGIEVRETNFAACRYVKENLSLDNLHFVRDDATNIANYGPFDAVFVCGLLYHLDQPLKFLSDAASVCRRVMILHTHIAHRTETPARSFHNLSELAENEGAVGRWYGEYGNVTVEQLESMREASWANHRSFWPTKEYLLNAMRQLGFATVVECFDCMNDITEEMTNGYYAQADRVMLAGIRPGPVDESRATLDAMRRSTSWRVTAPLRAVGRAFRR